MAEGRFRDGARVRLEKTEKGSNEVDRGFGDCDRAQQLLVTTEVPIPLQITLIIGLLLRELPVDQELVHRECDVLVHSYQVLEERRSPVALTVELQIT